MEQDGYYKEGTIMIKEDGTIISTKLEVCA